METRPFIDSPRKGIRRMFHYDHATDEFHIETIYHVPVEQNKLLFNAHDERTRWGNQALVARIPDTVLLKLRDDGTLYDDAKFRRWLNDPDNRVFRTRPGRV